MSEDPVAAQYDRWVYPPRVHDLAGLDLATPRLAYQDLRTLFHLYWPAGTPREDLDILVAGCGSMQAAAHAFLYPQARVVGIDISRGCLEHAETLKRKHNLTNLTLQEMRIEDAGALADRFDFISCYGVLHLLVDPAAGLRALGQALRPDGVMEVRVNGRYAWQGVLILQKMFRVLRLQADPAGIQAVRDVLACLPPNHPAQGLLRQAAAEVATDEGLVNVLLTARDRPFSVGECLDLVEEAGLLFQGWKENALYHADTRVPPGARLWPHLTPLEQRALWETVDCLDATITVHNFHVCRADRDPATYRIQFEDEAFLDFVPLSRITQSVPANRLRRQAAFIARPPFPPMALDERQAAVFKEIDGARPVRACLMAAGVAPDEPSQRVWARHFFGALWRAGYALFRLPPTS